MTSITKYKMFTNTKNMVVSTANLIVPFLALTILLASGHWILIRMYASYCAPPGIYGLVYTWFSTGSPVCQFINHIQVGLANNFVGIWAAAAAGMVIWIAKCMTSSKTAVE